MNEEMMNQRKAAIYALVQEETYKPMKAKDLAMLMGVPKEERKEFGHVLNELESEGKIVITEKGKITLPDHNILSGTFMGTRRGFGFVRVEGLDDDIFIPERGCKDALDGDTVQIQLWKSDKKDKKGKPAKGKRREAQVVKILTRKNETVVGTFQKSRNFGFVVVDNEKFNKDIYIGKSKTKGAVEGHKVVVKITDFGNADRGPEGEIIEILGHVDDPGVDILSVIKSFGLPEEFPDEVKDSLKKIPYEVASEDIAGRTDYRDYMTVTIDGEDAKDLDDAITLTKDGNMYHLGVHIADVSNYVTERSALDKEALNRATSIYLVDRVIPMLPHQLSNGICSLNAGVDRLALSCMMDVDASGKIVGHKISMSVINVNERMNYSDVAAILVDRDEALMERYKDQVTMFETMQELAAILRKNRKKKGSIDFDFPECKIILDKKGKPVKIQSYDRNVATKIIEEFMLAANETVAEEYFWMDIPFVYRTHEYPDLEKVQEVATLARTFGHNLKIGSDEVHPREIQKLIEQIEGTDEEAFLSRITLRSMKRAQYSTANDGHFGLASKYYCHFTSPIRRYPDLQIHRIIKEQLRGKLNEKRVSHYNEILDNVAAQSSTMERRADDAEREVNKIKKAQYMADHVGEEFQGIISGVTSWGMYVELPNTVEGMVRLTDITWDQFSVEEETYTIAGRYSGKRYRLGEQIKVIVGRVDTVASTIDFEIEEGEQSGEGH